VTKSRAVENKRLGLVELYAGIGCVARGFERTDRFETLLLTDVRNARDHCKTNYPGGAPYMYRDVGDIRASDIEDTRRGAILVPTASVLIRCRACTPT
jgi:site-specific DNA-cytosine methylase